MSLIYQQFQYNFWHIWLANNVFSDMHQTWIHTDYDEFIKQFYTVWHAVNFSEFKFAVITLFAGNFGSKFNVMTYVRYLKHQILQTKDIAITIFLFEISTMTGHNEMSVFPTILLHCANSQYCWAIVFHYRNMTAEAPACCANAVGAVVMIIPSGITSYFVNELQKWHVADGEDICRGNQFQASWYQRRLEHLIALRICHGFLENAASFTFMRVIQQFAQLLYLAVIVI